MRLPKIIAHRGGCGYAPENTLAALEKAKSLGTSWVEFDVQLTKDHQAVIFHDDDLDRTTNSSGLLKNKTLNELLNLDAGAWFSKEFSGEKIPTLEEWCASLLRLDLSMNLEIKPYKGDEEEMVKGILEVLKRIWPSGAPAPLLSSFNPEVLLLLKKFNSPYPCACLMHEWHDDWLPFVRQLEHCVSVNVNEEILTAERVRDIKNAGYGLLSYTVNEPKRAQLLFDWGVDGIFTDYPDRFSI